MFLYTKSYDSLSQSTNQTNQITKHPENRSTILHRKTKRNFFHHLLLVKLIYSVFSSISNCFIPCLSGFKGSFHHLNLTTMQEISSLLSLLRASVVSSFAAFNGSLILLAISTASWLAITYTITHQNRINQKPPINSLHIEIISDENTISLPSIDRH